MVVKAPELQDLSLGARYHTDMALESWRLTSVCFWVMRLRKNTGRGEPDQGVALR